MFIQLIRFSPAKHMKLSWKFRAIKRIFWSECRIKWFLCRFLLAILLFKCLASLIAFVLLKDLQKVREFISDLYKNNCSNKNDEGIIQFMCTTLNLFRFNYYQMMMIFLQQFGIMLFCLVSTYRYLQTMNFSAQKLLFLFFFSWKFYYFRITFVRSLLNPLDPRRFNFLFLLSNLYVRGEIKV